MPRGARPCAPTLRPVRPHGRNVQTRPVGGLLVGLLTGHALNSVDHNFRAPSRSV